MRWPAFGYGLLLGAGQCFVLRGVVRQALRQQRQPGARLPVGLLLALTGYLAAALAAVYLFTDHLLAAGVGLGVGLAATAAVLLVRRVRADVRRENAAQRQTKSP